MADIAEIGFAYNPAGLKKAKADLDAILPSAKKVEAAKLAVAKADLAAAQAALSAAKATGSATKEQIAAATAAVRKAAATMAAAKADQAAAGAASAVGAASAAAAGGLDKTGKAAQAAAGGIAAAGNAAQGAVSKISRLGSAANDNLNAVQATPANIAAQFQDIGVTAAAGMNPLLIALQQGTQLSVAFSGGLKNVGEALRQVFSPMALLTIGVVALIAYAIQLGMEFFNTSEDAKKLGDETKRTAVVTSAFGDAQSILGGIMDLTTGKMRDQTEAARTLAKALAFQGKVKAQQGLIESKAALNKLAGPSVTVLKDEMQTGGRFAGLTFTQRKLVQSQAGNVVEQFTKGKLSAEKAIDELGRLQAAGKTTVETFMEATTQINNHVQSIANAGIYDEVIKAENGDAGAARQFLKPDAPRKVSTASTGKTDSEKEPDRYKELTSDLDIYNETLISNAGAIGLVGAAAIEYNKQAEIYARAVEQNIDLSKGERQAVVDLAIAKAAAQLQANVTLESYYNEKNAILENISALEVERDGMTLSAKAASMMAFEKKLLNDERFKGIFYSDAEKQRLIELKSREADLTEEIKKRREATEEARKALEFDRAVTRGFFTDLMQGARDGQGAWGAFKNAFNNVMDSIIDKLLNEVLDAIFKVNSAAAGGGGGGLLGMIGKLAGVAGGLLGGGGAVGGIMSSTNASLGAGTAGMVAPGTFAKGDAFASTATGFAYGRGGANMGIMGEAGPEAVMPLQRGPDGSLGVQMYGNDNSVSAPPQQGPITFDMRGAVMTQDLLNQMNAVAAERADVAVQRNNAQNTRLAQRKFGK